MTAATLFFIFNVVALIGWILMLAGIFFNRPFLRDRLTGTWLPIVFSAGYTAIIIFFFANAQGGFDTLANVQLLFTDPWVMLAGWLHYLAFDMYIGSNIARQSDELGLPRWPLLVLLPLTFLFGPIGYLIFEAIKASKKGARA